MRSRYTAFTLARIDYVTATHDRETREDHDPEAARSWAESSEWLGLEIVSTDKGGPGDDEGTVEFEARYRSNGVEHDHREYGSSVRGPSAMKGRGSAGTTRVRAAAARNSRNAAAAAEAPAEPHVIMMRLFWMSLGRIPVLSSRRTSRA